MLQLWLHHLTYTLPPRTSPPLTQPANATRHGMITRPRLLQRTTQHQSPCVPPQHPSAAFTRPRAFHTTSQQSNNQLPNHYETLSLPTNATPSEIKKQFYALSKTHHPDLHPNDPTAAEKFVKISDAYNTLGSADKRAQYDRSFLSSSASGAGGPAYPSGSYSSAQANGPGARPASGLSRRRTQFRGPPPSFYRSGGWGAHGAKRAEAAAGASETAEARGRAASGPQGPSSEPGVGPGGFNAAGWGIGDETVPHFDSRVHSRVHQEIERTRHAGRKKGSGGGGGAGPGDVDFMPRTTAADFLMVSGVLGVVFGIAGIFSGMFGVGPGRGEKRKQKAVSAAASDG